MISSEIARAIANVAIFLEFTSEDVLDENASIQAMEQLASDLYALDDASRAELAAALRHIASSYDHEMSDFVANLPDALGIG